MNDAYGVDPASYRVMSPAESTVSMQRTASRAASRILGPASTPMPHALHTTTDAHLAAFLLSEGGTFLGLTRTGPERSPGPTDVLCQALYL